LEAATLARRDGTPLTSVIAGVEYYTQLLCGGFEELVEKNDKVDEYFEE